MQNAQEAQESNEDRSLVRYVNPADPTGPMLSTMAEVQQIRRTMKFEYEASPSSGDQKPKPARGRKKR